MDNIKRKVTSSIQNILNSDIAKGIITISSGAIMAQGLSFIFSPIITRIYPPEQYGVMTVLASVLAILSISSLRYEMAIPVERDDQKATNLLSLSVIILFVFSSVLLLLIFSFDNRLLNFINAEELIDYKYFIVLGIFFVGLKNILWQWLYREKKYNKITTAKVTENMVGNISKIGTGLLGYQVPGLLLSQIIKESFSIFPLSYRLLKSKSIKLIQINFDTMKEMSIKYIAYPMYETPGSFLGILKNQMPVFALSFYSSEVVGLYGLANTVVKIPMTLLGHSVRNVFYAEASSIGKDNPQKLKRLANKLFSRLRVIGLIPLFALILFGPFLFSKVFGLEWAESGVYSRYLAIAVYGDFIFSPVSRVYEVLDRVREKMFINIFGLLIVFVSFIFSRFISPNPNIAILLYSIAMFIYYTILYLYSKKYLNIQIERKEDLNI